jgi:two-component system, OmpR family, response regulator
MKTPYDLSIALVDDNRMYLKSLEQHLHQKLSNTKISTFLNGEECLKNVQMEHPDIIVLDYYLNGRSPFAKNGIEIMEEIKKIDPATKVIMISGQNKIDLAMETMKHGAFDYIIKNNNAFSHTQNAITNAAAEISFLKEKKGFTFWTNIILMLITAIICLSVYMHLHF